MRLRKPTLQSVSPTPDRVRLSTVRSSGTRLRKPPSLSTSSLTLAPLSSTASRLRLPSATARRFLDFDLEAVNAGFEDPQWTPVTVTCWAYTWIGEHTDVRCEALPVADFYDKDARRRFLLPLLAAIEAADVVTGHNIIRYDLPVLNGECMKVGLPVLKPTMAQDTMKIPRARFKKGMDNVSHSLGVREEKLPLSWAEWAAAYAEPGLETVKERCASDVLMHVQMRERMREEGWLRSPRLWKP